MRKGISVELPAACYFGVLSDGEVSVCGFCADERRLRPLRRDRLRPLAGFGAGAEPLLSALDDDVSFCSGVASGWVVGGVLSV